MPHPKNDFKNQPVAPEETSQPTEEQQVETQNGSSENPEQTNSENDEQGSENSSEQTSDSEN